MLHSEPLVFSFHVQSEPESLDPSTATNSISSYVLNALYVPLLTYQDGKLSSGGAKACLRVTATHYSCELRNNWFWSDGVPVESSQIVAGFEALKAEKSTRLSHFLNVKEVRAKSPLQIDFLLDHPDSDFLYKLIDPAIGPRRTQFSLKTGAVTYGAYFLKKRIPGRSLYLSPNQKFFISNPTRPDIEVMIVDSDSTALRLFEAKKLNFLRRLTTENIPTYKNSPQFSQRSLHRVDYIGLGPELADFPELRERLIYGLDPQYKKFLELFTALGRPGCFGLEKSVVGENQCYKYKQVKPYSTAELTRFPRLSLYYSLQGGDDISRTIEFFQAGWKKNVNLNIELRPTEHAVLTQLLATSPPPLFRRGVQLESPTCLAALEIFESNHPENYPRIKDKALDSVIAKLRSSSSQVSIALCAKGLSHLLATHRIIPLGAIQFAMLNDLNFVGFSINELNQLDVSRLSPKAAKTKVR